MVEERGSRSNLQVAARRRRRAGARPLGLLAALLASLCALVLPAAPAFGEGSVDLNQGPGTATRQGLAHPDVYIFHTYAQAGETIQLGSSAIGTGAGNILLWAPGADPETAPVTWDCAANGTDGRIGSREEELAGPQPSANPNAYAPCEFTVPPGGDGIYSVRFIPPDTSSVANPQLGSVDAPLVSVAQGENIAIWDITVRDTGGEPVDGRTFWNIASFRTSTGSGGGGNAASNVRTFAHTKTGYDYQVDLFDHGGINWLLASDDRGVVDAATGDRVFASARYGDPIEVPSFLPDMGNNDFRHSLSFNRLDPAVITGPGGLRDTRGFSDAPISPASNPLANATFTGAAGEQGATSRGSGGAIGFTSPTAMAGLGYTVLIDTNLDGIFGNGDDFVDDNSDLAADGVNSFAWNGLNGAGVAPACGTYPYEVRSTLSEVHFTQNDVENSGGMQIERLSLPGDPDLGDPFAASYNEIDPYPPGGPVSNSSPSTVVDGDSSSQPFHSWDASTGNVAYIDTWTRLPEVSTTGTLRLLCADLAITKTAPANVSAGGQVTWTITVTNNGPDASTGSTVTDAIPAGITKASSSTPGCTVAGAGLSCAVGPLAPGASTQVVLTGTAPEAKTCFTNAAAVAGEPHDPDLTNNEAKVQTCTLVSDLSIEKAASDQRVTLGDPLTYTLVVRNAGPDASLDTQVSDPVPSHLDVTDVSTANGKCSLANNNVRCALGSLAAGEQATIRVQTVAMRAGGVRNVAIVRDERCLTDPCDKDPAPVKVIKPRLKLSKLAAKPTVRAGQKTSYRIVVRNPSEATLRNVRTCDRLPAGLAFVKAKPKAKLSRGEHCWTAKRLGPGEKKVYRVVVRALRGAKGKLVNTATATSPDAKRARAKQRVRVIGRQVSAGGVTG